MITFCSSSYCTIRRVGAGELHGKIRPVFIEQYDELFAGTTISGMMAIIPFNIAIIVRSGAEKECRDASYQCITTIPPLTFIGVGTVILWIATDPIR